MKKLDVFILIVLIVFTVLCQQCNNDRYNHTIGSIDYNSIAISKKSLKDLMKVGKISRTVKLEANDASIIGSVETAIEDKNGDIYVGDFDSGKKVLRFNKDGKFLNGFGRPGQGPGEYTSLIRFDITKGNEVFLLDRHKLIKFEKSGKFLKEARLLYRTNYMKVIDDRIYLYVLGYLFHSELKTGIVILDSNFLPVGGFSPYESRLEKYMFIPINAMVKDGDKLFYIDIYDFALNVYSTTEKELMRLEIPNENDQLDGIWKKSHFSEPDRTEIKTRLHRFDNIISLKEKLFLWENYRLKNMHNYWLLDLKKRKALVLTYPGPEYFKENLVFDRIVGGYDNGIIWVYDDVEKFNKHKNEFPILKDISFSMEDNPILVFFEFNEI